MGLDDLTAAPNLRCLDVGIPKLRHADQLLAILEAPTPDLKGRTDAAPARPRLRELIIHIDSFDEDEWSALLNLIRLKRAHASSQYSALNPPANVGMSTSVLICAPLRYVGLWFPRRPDGVVSGLANSGIDELLIPCSRPCYGPPTGPESNPDTWRWRSLKFELHEWVETQVSDIRHLAHSDMHAVFLPSK